MSKPALNQRPVKDLTVWQAWTQRVKRDRYSATTVESIDKAIRSWERHTADPTIGSISSTTFALFRERASAAGLGSRTIGVQCRLVASIVRTFRPLVLPHRNVTVGESALLTVREAFAKHYLPASPGMAPRSVQKYKHHFNWLERFTSNPPVSQFDSTTFDEYRRQALALGLSATSIEGAISDILSVLRYLHRTKVLSECPWAGKRLKRRPTLKPTPSIDDLSKVYALCERATWPVRSRRLNPHCARGRFKGPQRLAAAVRWWKTLFALAYFTALRRSDLLTLRWDEIDGGWIRRKMKKTGFTVEIPIHPVLQQHLDELPTKKRPCVLGYAGSFKQIRRTMKELAAAARVKPFTIQGLRRLSAQQFERARAGSGGIALGHVYRSVDRFYLNPTAALVEALPNLAIPEGMGPQPSNPAPKVNALEVLRGLGKDELVKLLSELLAGKVPA